MGKTAKWRKFSVEEIKKIVQDSYSIREVAKKMGYAENGGGTIAALKKMFIELQIDTSHFTGQNWSKNKYDYSWMKKGIKYHSNYRHSLIYLRGRKCERCGLEKWLEQPIPLEVHHKDGDKTNNETENLELLCPNCHTFTEFYRGRK